MSKKTIVVCGYGPGISSAVADRFGREGFAVALVARNEERLAAGVKSLREKGIDAAPFRADLGNPAEIRATFDKVRAALGPISVLLWNAYGNGAGDVTTASEAELRAALDVPILGLVTAVQAALPDLKKDKSAAVLVTNGGLGFASPQVTSVAVQYNLMGLSIANAAKMKLVAMLAEKLKGDGIYVGELVVSGTVKGSAFDHGNGNLEASTIAEKYWQLTQERKDHTVTVSAS